jgi:hypothetical protein
MLGHLTAILLIPCGLSGATDADQGQRGEVFDRIVLPPGITKDALRDALAEVLTERQWTVQLNTDRQVVGYQRQRGAEATVTLVPDGETVTIYCEGWALNRAGERAKVEMPRSWLGALRRDLTRRFASMAPETR